MMNDELIKALRWCADNTLCVDLSTGEQCPRFKYREICKQKKQMHEAADAIERLTAEIDRKDKAIERLRDLMKHYKAAYRTAYKLYQEARNEQQP